MDLYIFSVVNKCNLQSILLLDSAVVNKHDHHMLPTVIHPELDLFV